MDPSVALKQLRTDVRYRGNFNEHSWGLFTEPVLLYRSLLKHLAPFGATLQGLRAETADLPSTQVSCSLIDLDTNVRVRLDRLEFDCWKLHEVGAEAAERALQAVWAALREADESIQLGPQTVELNILAKLVGSTSAQFLSRYVKIPMALGSMEAGVAFYSPPIANDDDTWVNLVLDRVFKEENQILIKTTVGCTACTIPIDSIAQNVREQMTRVFGALCLHIQADEN